MMKIIIFFLLFCQHQLVTADNYELDFGISLEDKIWTPVLVGEPNIIISKSVLEVFRQTKTFETIIEMNNNFYLETSHLTLLPIIVKVTTMLLELSFKIECTLPGEQLLFTLQAERQGSEQI